MSRMSFDEMRARRFEMDRPYEATPAPEAQILPPSREAQMLAAGRANQMWALNDPDPYSREPKSIHSPAGAALQRFVPPVPYYARSRKRFAQR